MRPALIVNIFPELRTKRPQYFMYLQALCIFHGLLSASELLGKYDSDLWDWFGGEVGVRLMGLLHVLIIIAIIYGSYRSCSVIRIALAASVFIYTTTAILMLNAFIWPLIQRQDPTFSGMQVAFFGGLAYLSRVVHRHSKAKEILYHGDLT